MRKLSLKLDDLAVESFQTQVEEGVQGTVRGNDSIYLCETERDWICTNNPLSCDDTCNTADNNTCPTGDTCYQTCQNSCNGTCDTCFGTCIDGSCPNSVCDCPTQPC